MSVYWLGFIALVFANPDEGAQAPELGEWLLFAFFPISLSIGMIIAWWNERIGGIIAVSSLAIFYLIEFLQSGSFPVGIYFFIVAMPGFLFLAASFVSTKSHPK
jgi:hypothetical protein